MADATDVLQDLSSRFLSMQRSQEAVRVLGVTSSLLRCFLFFDICYLITGVALITMALADHLEHKERMLMLGGFFGVFASLSALVNSLASHGIRTWKRGLVLPWLIFFLMLFGMLFMHLVHALYFKQARWRHVFLFFAVIGVFSCWRHMYKQYLLMARPKPEAQVVVDIESIMREYLATGSHVSNAKDLPPTYEDVTEKPPEYDATMQEGHVNVDEKPNDQLTQ